MSRSRSTRVRNTDATAVDLGSFSSSDHDFGRGKLVRVIWHFINALFFASALLPSYRLKRSLLRLFGAKIGRNVVIKPGVSVKAPWMLEIGDNTWVGEKAWIDCLGPVKIGANCCISQGAYLCTGSHDYREPTFDLIIRPIVIEDGAWIACRATVTQGVTVGTHAVLAAGSTLSHDAEAWMIYRGTPATPVKRRVMNSDQHPDEPVRDLRLVFPDKHEPAAQPTPEHIRVAH